MPNAIREMLEAGSGVNVPPLAAAAGVSANTIYRAIHRGEIEATKIGKRVTVPAHVARRLLKLDAPEAA